jgi:cellulose biosynthesis protein BcsQ/energy-coupling factor transporter ATP-binding protein EcfA2
MGEIITFYSFKGGTGRSMALANVAWILASNNKRVLTVDWDLEAPGLHRYYSPFLLDKNLKASQGVIDMVVDFSTRAMTPFKEGEEKNKDWHLPFADVRRYAVSIDWRFGSGCLDLLPAGRQGPNYSTRVNSFSWDNFYERLGGGTFLEAVKASMRDNYDYVLIDSRTGVSDTSGICTVQMPENVVVCFTLNNQSMEGASEVAASIVSHQRAKSKGAEVRLFPVPMRVERFEKQKLESARDAAKLKFDQYLWHLSAEQRAVYWDDVETFYEPFYAYEEILATFGDKPLRLSSMLASAERLTGYLSNSQDVKLAPPTEEERQRVVSLYARQRVFSPSEQQISSAIAKPSKPELEGNTYGGKLNYDVFLSYNSSDHGVVEDIGRKLRAERLEPFLDRWELAPGTRWRSKLEQTLSSCKAVAILVGPGEMGSWQQREVDIALDLQSRNPSFPVIPVLLPGCEPPLGFLRQLTWVDLRTQTLDRGISILAKAARGSPGIDLQQDFHSVRDSICPYRGLLHFREEDAPFFFGREAAIDNLTEAVQRQPFVAVVGASGSGKSSVVRAGLVPKLRSDRRTVWEAVVMVPTDKPLEALAQALVPLMEPTMSEVDRLTASAKLAEHFQLETTSLNEIVERILEKQPGTNRLLIVVDQFEELYTLTSDEEARRRFLDELLASSSRVGSKANIAITLRGDFVGKVLAYRPMSDRLQDAQINLGPMTRKELECAIRNPAEKVQLEFESGLVKRILYDVGDESGDLPLLEYLLKELWDKRRDRVLLNETYDAIGGLQGAVATKADQLLKDLSPEEQKVLQRVFLRIVRPSESGLDTRRRAAFSELPPDGAKLVLKLANERLLVTNQSASGVEQTVEIAQEALISNWATLRAWVNEDREFLLWRDRLVTFLIEWKRAGESDDALLRGPFLIEAQKWMDLRNQDLSDEEREFISASRVLRERRERAALRLRRFAIVMAVIALAAIAALIVLVVLHFGSR